MATDDRTETAYADGLLAVYVDDRVIAPGWPDPAPAHWEIWKAETFDTLASYPDLGENSRVILSRYVRERDASPDHSENG